MATVDDIQLDTARHAKYWKRCSQLLPEQYTAGEASRMSFGFFIVAALDLLNALEDIPSGERNSWIEWIYSCQVPDTGGFRGFTGTHLDGQRSPQNWHWDPASLPNTYFALATLVILGDDLTRVKRRECLEWVASLQHDNGSFGEFLAENDAIEGGNDPRLCMCAAGIESILLADGDGTGVRFDEDKACNFITNCQSQDGGIAEKPLLEPHSGLNYCGIATYSFLGRSRKSPASAMEVASECDFDATSCIRWMLDRQTSWVDDEEEEDDDDDDDDEEAREDDKSLSSLNTPVDQTQDDTTMPEILIAGFNGRCGKIADTCYCFWNAGALNILQHHHLVNVEPLRRYLLQKVVHQIGGFGKAPGELPGSCIFLCMKRAL